MPVCHSKPSTIPAPENYSAVTPPTRANEVLLAVEMMKDIFKIHGVPEVVHADRGTSMTSKTVAALLSDLEVTRSYSRPRVSNDNPYSEALFKTMNGSNILATTWELIPTG